MFIMEKPYVSEFFVDTLVQNDWPVLYNEAVDNADIEEGAFNLCSEETAVQYYLQQEFPLIYSNSEHATAWVLENLPQSNLSSYIKLFKDKVAFRDFIQELYPNFQYKSVEYASLQTFNTNDINFPVVLKPAVGFLSMGVHTIKDASEWKTAIKEIKDEMKYAEKIYSSDVINSSNFIIEEMISGDEYAVDAFFDRNGEVVILNIYQHPLNNEKDVKDRIYIMSTEIMVRYMAKFALVIRQIGELKGIKNLAIHIEMRVTPDGQIIPIEVNPMRFAGWCTADVAKYAWGINVYECFYNNIRPDWNEILSKAGRDIYYFSMVEVPISIPTEKIKNFDYSNFLANYSNILEVRKIDYRVHPLFAIIFGSTKDEKEINRILSLDTKKFIIS